MIMIRAWDKTDGMEVHWSQKDGLKSNQVTSQTGLGVTNF